MTPDDLEALSQQAHAEQEQADIQHYRDTIESEIADCAGEQLERAQTAGLIADAGQERRVMFNLFLELGRSQTADQLDDELDNVLILAERYLNGAFSERRRAAFDYHELQVRVRSIVHQVAIRTWMEALRVHGLLLPAKANCGELNGKPLPTIEAPPADTQP